MTSAADANRFSAFRAQRFFGSLDGLRAASILAVVWHHAGERGELPIAARGFLGVDMFFVISGFLIVTLLLRERDARGGISLAAFWTRRALRIFPLYYGLLAGLALLLLGLRPGSNMSAPFLRELPFHLTYTSNWIEVTSVMAIAWSLAAEEQFYFVWPPIERFLRGFTAPILVLAIATNQALNFRLLPLGGEAYASLEILQATFTPILLGVAVAHLLHDPRHFARAWRWLGGRWAGPVFAALLLALLMLPHEDIAGWPRLSMQLAMAGLLTACVIRDDHVLAPLWSFAPLRRIGAVSYGIYLLHLLAMHPVNAVLERIPAAPAGTRFVLTVATTWAVAELSFRFYETPFLRLKRRFARA